MPSKKPEESNVMFLIALGLLLISLVSFFSTDVGLTIGPRMADAVKYDARAPITESLARVKVTSLPPPAYAQALAPPRDDLISPFREISRNEPESINTIPATTSATSGGSN